MNDAPVDAYSTLYSRALLFGRSELVTLAKRYLARERMTVVSLGPVGSVRADIEKLGFVVTMQRAGKPAEEKP